MNANPGEGPGSDWVDGPNRIITVVAIPVVGITWPFSARHNRLNAKRRRLINRYTNASLSYGKRSRGLDLAESPPKGGGEARGSGIRRPEGAERVAVAVAVITPDRGPKNE